MRQYTAERSLAIVSVGGQRWQRRRSATVINNGEGSSVGEDGGESSEIFDYSIEPGGTIQLRPST